MATRPAERPRETHERIPFYRNVKTLGVLAQLAFAAVVLIGAFVLYRNVSTALARSNLPANFSFLGARAGVPIGETPIRYNPSDTYARALLVGVVNTLKVSLVGVVLTTLLGILIGVMRLSKNWLLRQLALWYVELLRNTPLAVQLIFWFSLVLVVPPRVSNAVELPGRIFLSQIGLALPWLYPSYSFSGWLLWLAAGAALFVALWLWRRWWLIRAERPGNPWLWPLATFVVVAGLGYLVVSRGASLPENATVAFDANRGRGEVFIDANGNGRLDRSERTLGRVPVVLRLEQGQLSDISQDLSESRRIRYSTFRFARLEPGEYRSAEASFADPEAAEGLSIHMMRPPYAGLIYRDRNGNGRYDAGEEIDAEAERERGFTGIRVNLVVEGFERRVVADRDGGIRLPPFESVGAGGEEAQAQPAGGGGGLGALFNRSGGEEAAALEVTAELRPATPLVLSTPTIPRSDYEGGVQLSVAYLTLLLGLVIYTASFIAEIVRGGILAVPKGQREAAKSLGLSDTQTFSLIVFPQAMRVILPPLISQYLNLTKNSSLAILVTYQDFFAISNIVANQTGATVPVILIVIGGYLLISLVFAFVLNVVNARLAIVER